MRLLVDTHVLLWAAGQPSRLSKRARSLLNDPQVQLNFSSASLWEIAIKRGLGREDFRIEPRHLRRGLIDNGWRELPITSEHAIATLDLPSLHRDPFDRLLVAQAHVEGMILITSDGLVAKYPGAIRKV